MRQRLALTTLVLLTSCQALTHTGTAFVPAGSGDTFRLRIDRMLFASAATADSRAELEIGSMMARRGYKSYEIIERNGGLFDVDYTVRFGR